MAAALNLIGQKYGKLLVLERAAENTKNGTSRWKCLCDCGNITTVPCTKLTGHKTVSCGCYRNRQNGKSTTRLYHIWRAMHERCENPKHDHFNRYGGRGIKVCNEWDEFLSFEKWAVENGYQNGLSIDRINVNAGYSPDNCRWQNQKQQMNNISSNRYVEYQGKKFTVSQFADFLNVPYYTIMNHVKAGWSAERIVSKHART